MTALLDPLTASSDRWKWQLRDKNGQWIQMGSEVTFTQGGTSYTGTVIGSPGPGKATVKLANGQTMTVATAGVTATGKSVGAPGAPATKPTKAVVPALKNAQPHKSAAKRTQSSTGRSSSSSSSSRTALDPPDDRRLNTVHRTSKSIEGLLRIRAREMGRKDVFGEKESRSQSTNGGSKDGTKSGAATSTATKGSSTGSKKPRKDTRKKLTQSQIDAVNGIFKSVYADVKQERYGPALSRLARAKDLLDDTSAPWLLKRIDFLLKGLRGVMGITASALIARAGPSWTWQLRDRLGQWLDMHSEVRWLGQGTTHTGHVVDSPSVKTAVVIEDVTGRRVNLSTNRLTGFGAPRGSDLPGVVGPFRHEPMQIVPTHKPISSTDYMALRTLRMDAIKSFGGSTSRMHPTEYALARDKALRALDGAANKGVAVKDAVKKLAEARRQIAAARAWNDGAARQERLQMLEAQIVQAIRRMDPDAAVMPKHKGMSATTRVKMYNMADRWLTASTVLSSGTRHVRTPEGAQHYGQPIGSVITTDLVAHKIKSVIRAGRDGWTNVEKYGLDYDTKNAANPAVVAARAIPDSAWDDVPVQDWRLPLAGGQPLHANEPDLKDKTLAKVHEPGFEFRPGYFNQIVIDEAGHAHIVDGHHRVGLHAEAGHDSLPAKVIDLRERTPAAAAVRREMGSAPSVDAEDLTGGRAAKARLIPHPPANQTVAVNTSMATLTPAAQAFVNNGGGTLDDPVHVYPYKATKQKTDKKTKVVTPATPARTLTVRQSDVAKHIRDVVSAAVEHNQKANVKASEEAIAEARQWYQNAHDIAVKMQTDFNKEYPDAHLTLEQVAGVIAAVSPRQRWDQNIISAERVIKAYLTKTDVGSLDDLKDETGAGLRDNVEIGLKILDGQGPGAMTGTKRKSFWNNIMDPSNAYDVTIDGWMASAIWRMGGTYSDGMPVDEKALSWIDHGKKANNQQVIDSAGYVIMADAVRDVARDLGLLPHEVQAIYWVAVGGGQKNTQMWSNEPKRTEAAPGYNLKGDRVWTKTGDNPEIGAIPKAEFFRYGHFVVVHNFKTKNWMVSDPLDSALPSGRSKILIFKSKKDAAAHMNSKYPSGVLPTPWVSPGQDNPNYVAPGADAALAVARALPAGNPFAVAASGAPITPMMDADGGEWSDPTDYDAVAISDMATALRDTEGPVYGILSAWEMSGPHPTAGQITWCWEDPDAWDLVDVDPEWFIEQVAQRVLL